MRKFRRYRADTKRTIGTPFESVPRARYRPLYRREFNARCRERLQLYRSVSCRELFSGSVKHSPFRILNWSSNEIHRVPRIMYVFYTYYTKTTDLIFPIYSYTYTRAFCDLISKGEKKIDGIFIRIRLFFFPFAEFASSYTRTSNHKLITSRIGDTYSRGLIYR